MSNPAPAHGEQMRKLVRGAALAIALAAAQPAFAGQDEDNHDTISGASTAERQSMKNTMSSTAYGKHRWGSSAVNAYVDGRWANSPSQSAMRLRTTGAAPERTTPPITKAAASPRSARRLTGCSGTSSLADLT